MTWDFLEWFFIRGKLQGAEWDRAWLVLEGELPTGLRIHSSLSVLVADAGSLNLPKTLRMRASKNIKTSAGLCPPTEPRPMVKSP